MTGSPLGSVDKALQTLQRLGAAGGDGLTLAKLSADLGLDQAERGLRIAKWSERTGKEVAWVRSCASGNYC